MKSLEQRERVDWNKSVIIVISQEKPKKKFMNEFFSQTYGKC